MTRQDDGYFHVELDDLSAGALYQIRLTDEPELLADPASRFQPQGPAGPSAIVDPGAYQWHDDNWKGIGAHDQVLYEMHFGTFTPKGTYGAAAKKLPHLRDLGITCLEVMPVNEFFGAFGWGYDGVLPYAPTHLYGEPDELRNFVDQAHQNGIGVILDVVYNHFGVGDKFRLFSEDYFTDRYANEWGSSLNFDGENCHGVREFVAMNAAYWIDEFHFDGLRIDATQALFDASDEHIIALISRKARSAAGTRSIYLVAENEPQDSNLIRSIDKGGLGLDAAWNDDFHHSAVVAATGRREAYYHDHHGQAQEFVSAAKYGYLYQGQRYDWQDAPRGNAGFDLGPEHFVHFLQNHDQVANSANGLRLNTLTSPARMRALTALLLLGPQTPMLFQGQEFAATTPFFYFADHSGSLVDIVRGGRAEFLKQFPSLMDPEFETRMALPSDPATFEQSKLDWEDRSRNAQILALHKDLIALRRTTPVFSSNNDLRGNRNRIDGNVLATSVFLLRFFSRRPQDERLLLVNLGPDLPVCGRPEPLLAPPRDYQWSLCWSSEDFNYGGAGRRPVDLQHRWSLSSDCAILLEPRSQKRNPTPSAEKLGKWQRQISNCSVDER